VYFQQEQSQTNNSRLGAALPGNSRLEAGVARRLKVRIKRIFVARLEPAGNARL